MKNKKRRNLRNFLRRKRRLHDLIGKIISQYFPICQQFFPNKTARTGAIFFREKEVMQPMGKKNKKTKKEKVCLPDHAIMEITDVSEQSKATGSVRLTDEAVEKGKAWTEFTKL